MPDPAETIREALLAHSTKSRGDQPLDSAALAALTELEQQLAAGERARRQITEGMASLCNRAEAAEADRDRLQADLDCAQTGEMQWKAANTEAYERALAAEAGAQTLRDALGQACDVAIWMSGSSDFSPEGVAHEGWLKMREQLNGALAVLAAARAALATPDTPPDA